MRGAALLDNLSPSMRSYLAENGCFQGSNLILDWMSNSKGKKKVYGQQLYYKCLKTTKKSCLVMPVPCSFVDNFELGW